MEGLRPIKEGIEQLPQRLPQQLPQQIGYPLSYSSELIPIPTASKEEEEEEEVFPNSDTTFGFYERDGKIFIGDKKAYIGRNDTIIGSKTFEKTPGLKQLLLSKNPKEGFFNNKDLRTYEEILVYTNTMYRGNNPKSRYPKASRSQKWEKIVRPIWLRHKKNWFGR